MELFKASQQRAGKILFQDLMNRCQRNLNEAKKDNDFIYHDRIPDLNSLQAIGKAQPAKILQLTHPLSTNFKGWQLNATRNCFIIVDNFIIFRFIC